MKVTREVLIPAEEGAAVMEVNTCYRSPQGLGLLQQYSEVVGSDTFGRYFQRSSEDNGRTWSQPRLIFRPRQTPQGMVRWGEGTLFLDEARGTIIHWHNHDLYPADHYTGEVRTRTRILLQVSGDGGESWTPARQLVQRGHDPEHWAEGVFVGRNCIAISFCAPITTRQGRVLLPAQLCPLGSDYSNSWLIKWEAGCFLGEWVGRRLEWERSQFVRIDPALSSRGLCEPTLAELEDGRLLMVCRGSNYTMPQAPGYKWFATSGDGGDSWSPPAPFTYADGRPFYSPATGSRLLRTRRGRLYWIGNITPDNPDGNRPRYPLQIAQVDEGRLGLVPGSVRLIEDRQPGDPPAVQFSNFRVYEDRETGDLLLAMARIQERGEADLSSPSYQYRLRLEA